MMTTLQNVFPYMNKKPNFVTILRTMKTNERNILKSESLTSFSISFEKDAPELKSCVSE